jgi:hypothetical protein
MTAQLPLFAAYALGVSTAWAAAMTGSHWLHRLGQLEARVSALEAQKASQAAPGRPYGVETTSWGSRPPRTPRIAPEGSQGLGECDDGITARLPSPILLADTRRPPSILEGT